jgi:hypothetical protein
MGLQIHPVAQIVAFKSATRRVLDLFYHPGFKIPEDFDELPEEELRAWCGEGS